MNVVDVAVLIIAVLLWIVFVGIPLGMIAFVALRTLAALSLPIVLPIAGAAVLISQEVRKRWN